MAKPGLRNTAAPLVVIVGPTASGKTQLAVSLAKRFKGEIICADSRTIYRGMDIGTAKPSLEEQEGIPHWGLNLVEPGDRFSVADFKRYADAKIEEIRRRGRIPFLVGGSGLYVDAVLFDYKFGGVVDEALRSQLQGLTTTSLYEYCIKNNIKLPENSKNKRYLIRAIEQKGINTRRRTVPISNSIIVGITTEKDNLEQRIARRNEQLFDKGVVKEAIALGEAFGWENEAFTGNIYRVIYRFLKGEVGKGEMHSLASAMDRRLAKKQRTWFRRNPSITWLTLIEAEAYIAKQLAK